MGDWLPDPYDPTRWHHIDFPSPTAGDPGHDPVVDPDYPRITAYDPSQDPAWPIGWGSEPTERDRAVIDAGNA